MCILDVDATFAPSRESATMVYYVCIYILLQIAIEMLVLSSNLLHFSNFLYSFQQIWIIGTGTADLIGDKFGLELHG